MAMRQVVVVVATSGVEACPGRDGKSPAWLSWSRMTAQRCKRSEVAKSDRGGIRVKECPSFEVEGTVTRALGPYKGREERWKQ